MEDTPVNRLVGTRMAERLGCVVTCAENGRVALECLETQSFDIILMDCQMPEMDGFEATRRIRELPGDQEHPIPILAMTAHAMRGDRERCLESGMNEYLSKPIDIERLRLALEQWL